MAKKTDAIIKRLEDIITNDPSIRDPSRVFFRVHKKGFLFARKTRILIEGSVANDGEYHKIDKIIKEESFDVPIENHLVINAPLQSAQ